MAKTIGKSLFFAFLSPISNYAVMSLRELSNKNGTRKEQRKTMEALIERPQLRQQSSVYFLECEYERGRRSYRDENVFLIGPYRTAEEASRRTNTVTESLKLPVKAVHIRSCSAERLPNNRYIVEGTRVFSANSMVPVAADGSVTIEAKEFHLPSDFFDSSVELV